VCLMSVNPGFGGQKFIERTYQKTTDMRNLLDAANSKAHIEIDGGVGVGNWKALVNAGADVLVAGSSTFNAVDPHAAIIEMKGRSR
jgi:ribulose-phosphate 3-epimerase